MLLSQTSKYALEAAIHLGERGREQLVPVAEIAEALGVPRNYLSKILHRMAQGGVLDSERGPRGGFRLAKAPEELGLADILAPLDPGLADRKCLLGRAQCSDTDPCPAHERWRELAGTIEDFLRSTTLGDLIRNQPTRRSRRRRKVAGTRDTQAGGRRS